ncbi:UDP-N-acetylmuramoyl-L-alanyl-D-glutamate--2,6-diaminopimelate ligase [Exiguobacterium sp. Leaf196]|jgi:UDP-N-acetylmuramoyl-L-alanyl-D-glutamate--2,6-diaminopimelate ligase|uniref:UDP-N-acetylmuramoyl-L-alanyl-D-glutamate--2, 6-diaminopimelate ligase n=1 Tax=Exiguobacterium sp. Leaf196 TaxID=1736298 RepID=UPI000700C02A|nr:UDP-N-acetylmuramoyl-L-alanyl-D-glutamate--2,6-diaminopimelate ligase [Exiguobacterium sp. Leaf196]KQS40396.1 UDP-N-acetylmuramyl peptide synthase [Exiguobacterium sp. Leaf196]
MNRLAKLLTELLPIPINEAINPLITNIATDSRQIKLNGLFICINGYTVDGHDYINQAIENGAVAILAERPFPDCPVPIIIVPDTKRLAGQVANRFYNQPSQKMRVYGVTGTNGKTTTTKLAYDLFRATGVKAGMISTVGARIDEEFIETPNTTPEAIILHRLLFEMVEQGVTDCIIEVSSHALAEGRVEGVSFHSAAFTNLSHDHLDYHHSMEEYAKTKALLFQQVAASNGQTIVLNREDGWSRVMRDAAPLQPVIWYTTQPHRTSQIAVEWLTDTINVRIDETTTRVPTALLGEFNAANLAAAMGLLRAGNANLYALIRHIPELELPKGRLERLEWTSCEIYLDYAHTPDGLEKCLQALTYIGESLSIVLSAAGERDRSKRAEMGRIASKYCEHIIATVHDARSEAPNQIIDELIVDVPKERLIGCHTSRHEALVQAAHLAHRGQRVVIVGKGHDEVERIGTKTIPFNEKHILLAELERLSEGESVI